MNDHAREHLEVAQMHVDAANATLPWIHKCKIQPMRNRLVGTFILGVFFSVMARCGCLPIAIHEPAAQQEVRP